MDALGAIFLFLLLMIIIYSNYLFLKKLKSIKNKKPKHKLIYFLTSIIFPCIIIFLLAALTTNPFIINELGINIDNNTYTSRIIFGCIIFPLSILINLFFLKFYLSRISKITNEIESIGTE